MKTGWKVFWIVCAGAIAIGFVCCAVAFGLGVTQDAIHGRFPNGFGYVGGSGKEAEDIHESFKGITEIDAEIAAGEVSVYARMRMRSGWRRRICARGWALNVMWKVTS